MPQNQSRKSRRKKHPHDPFPSDFNQWCDAVVWAVLIVVYVWLIGAFCQASGIV